LTFKTNKFIIREIREAKLFLPPFFLGGSMYNFKKEGRLYFYIDSILYPVDVYPDLSFSQTFNEQSYNKKTLHNQLALNQGATIVEANPANFSFTIPVKYATELAPLSGLFEPDYITGTIAPIDIYVDFSNKIYKLATSVIENITFNIESRAVFTASVSGTASILSEVASLPATPEVSNTDPYTIIRGVEVTVDGIVLPSIAAVNLEVNNSIEWTKNSTIHKSVVSQIAYKESYSLTERRVSGSVTEFILENSISSPDFDASVPIVIKLYTDSNQNPPFLTFNLAEAVYTRRLNVEELLTRVYDFRLTDNTVTIIPIIRS